MCAGCGAAELARMTAEDLSIAHKLAGIGNVDKGLG